MISNEQYIALSLELNLFFLRIAREHAIFIEAGFPPKYGTLIREAEMNKVAASSLLMETISLANGNISLDAVNSGELVTSLTLEAEIKTQQLTGIIVDSNLTKLEYALKPGIPRATPALLQKISSLNLRALAATSVLVEYIFRVYREDIACRIFNNLYPLNIDHVGREMIQYFNTLQKVQRRDNLRNIINAYEELVFWNNIMQQHAEFIRGLLDPTERQLFNKANQFAQQFEKLVEESKGLTGNPAWLQQVITQSLNETMQIKEFKLQGEIGILSCKIRSLINPLLADHVLREANRFIRIIRIIQSMPMDK